MYGDKNGVMTIEEYKKQPFKDGKLIGYRIDVEVRKYKIEQ